MTALVLVLNAGSSSIKFGLFDVSADEPALLCKGLLDEHEAKPRLVARSPSGETLFEEQREAKRRMWVLSAFTCAHEYAETYRSPKWVRISQQGCPLPQGRGHINAHLARGCATARA